jgi:fatty-acyl-CoA synthase
VLSADGWLDTGDLGFLIEGEIVITGRAKDLIILNGRNIWPQDLEWTAEPRSRPAQRRRRAFSVPARAMRRSWCWSRRAAATPTPAQALVERGRRPCCAPATASRPRSKLVGAHALPQTSSGKLSRSKAKRAYLAGAYGEPEHGR